MVFVLSIPCKISGRLYYHRDEAVLIPNVLGNCRSGMY
jgi:hypothetical protein